MGSERRAETISAIAVSRSNPEIVYVGTEDGRVFRLERGGDGLWTADPRLGAPGTTLPVVGPDDLISDIAIHPTNPNHVYVSIGYVHAAWRRVVSIATGRIFFSDDGGQNWQPRGNHQLNVNASGITILHGANPVNAITIDPAHNPAHVLIGCDVGVFLSTNEGVDWVRWDQNLPHTSVSDLQIHEPTRIVRATTRGRGVWERRLDAPGVAPPLVDLYLRDNPLDTGRRDTPADVTDPLPPFRHVVWTSSADIKVDAPAFITGSHESPSSTVDYTPGGAIDFIGFEKLEHEDPRETDNAKVYVQVQNRGPEAAANVRVRVFYTEKGADGQYPDLPADFWAVFPNNDSATPNLWRPIGPAATIAEVRPAEPGVVSWNWEVPRNTNSTVALLAVVSNALDPVNEARRSVADVVRTNKHVALRELSVGIPSAEIFVLVLIGLGVAGLITAKVVSELD